ncbi:MAG: hypothetical protein AB7I19_05910 [Planctomycetota bacterium]
MRAWPLSALLAVAGLVSAAAGQEEVRKRIEGVWAVELPTAWDALSPADVPDVRGLPFDTPPGVFSSRELTVFGDVRRWLREGVGGGMLVVAIFDGERDLDDTLLAELRRPYDQGRTERGEHRVIDRAEKTTVGADAHPAFLLEVRGLDAAGSSSFRSLDVCTVSSGKLLILSFRAWENEWQDIEPRLRRMVASLTFARPPRPRKELSDALIQAAVFGGIVVVVLFVLRAFLRGRPPEHQLPSTRDRGPEPGSRHDP